MVRTCLAASTGYSTIFVAIGLVWLRGWGQQWKCEIQDQGEPHWKCNTLTKAYQNHNKMAKTLPHNLVATTSICKNHTAVQKMKPPNPTSTQMVGAWLFACWDPWCPIVGNTWNVDSFDRWSSQNSCIYHYIPTKNWTWMPFCRPASPFGGSSKFSWWKIPV